MKQPKLFRSDRGASLIMVLIIISVVGLVMGVVLSQGDTNIRATVELRSQSADQYAADAAANVALKQLSATNCNDSSNPLVLSLGLSGSPFYAAAGSADGPLNATAVCTPDTATGTTTTTTTVGTGVTVGSSNTPKAALVTVGQTSEAGITASGNWNLCVNGGSVWSYSSITTNNIKVGTNSTGSLTACPDQVSTGLVVSAKNGCAAGTFTPTGCTTLTSAATNSFQTPSLPPPSDPITRTDPHAICQGSNGTYYAAFQPGKYTILGSSSTRGLQFACSNGSSWVSPTIAWFTPGTYYFDFGSTSWTVPNTLIAGTPTKPNGTNPDGSIKYIAIPGLDPTSDTTLTSSTLSNLTQATNFPGACLAPSYQTANGGQGAEFVFGGQSTLTMPSSGLLDVCASYVDATTVPVAVYGVCSGAPPCTGTLTVPGGTVTPETGNVAASGGSLLIAASPNGHESFHFEGYFWAPAAGVIMTYKNSSGQEFNWGVVVRAFQITGNGSSPSGAFVTLPASSPGAQTTTTTTYGDHYITVYTCSPTGIGCVQSSPNQALRVRVKYDGSPSVVSWDNLR